jgi:hypothetical protein
MRDSTVMAILRKYFMTMISYEYSH